jgi:type II secretory pathway component PulM
MICRRRRKTPALFKVASYLAEGVKRRERSEVALLRASQLLAMTWVVIVKFIM